MEELLIVEFHYGDDFQHLCQEERHLHLENMDAINSSVIQVVDGSVDVETYLDTVEHYGQNMDSYTEIVEENLVNYFSL